MTEPRWLPEEDELLRKLWADKTIPAAQIGKELKRTKNAIIGRARRIGVARRRERIPTVTPPPSDGRRPVIQYRALRHLKRYSIAPVELLPEEHMLPLNETGVPFLEAQSHHCRAIIGSSNDTRGLVIYCGRDIREGSAYSFCEEHFARYTVPKRR